MLKVNVRLTTGTRFMIPIPYMLLRIVGSILCSRLVWSLIDKAGHLEKKHLPLPPVEREEVANLIHAVKTQKGLTLVDIKAKDGTSVTITA